MQVQSLGGEDPLEEERATDPSVLAWRIPWTEEPGGLQSIGSQSRTHAHTHPLSLIIKHSLLHSRTTEAACQPAVGNQVRHMKCTSVGPHRGGTAVDLGKTPREVRRDYRRLQYVRSFCWRSSSKHVCKNMLMSFTGQSIGLFL